MRLRCRMADLSLVDALTEPTPEIEGEIKRDFIATLEAEAFDDVVGETVGKTDYIPLLDVDENIGNSDLKKKPCSDTSPVEGTPSSKPAVLANGDHEIEGNDTTVFPTEFLGEKIAYQDHINSQNWPEDTDFCYQPEQVMNPTQTDTFNVHQDDDLAEFLFLPSDPANAAILPEQKDPSRDIYGMPHYDTCASEAGDVPPGWSVEVPDSLHPAAFLAPESFKQPLQPAEESAKEVEMASEREKTPTELLDIILPGETEKALAQDTGPPTEPEMALARDLEPVTKSDVALPQDMVLFTETEAVPANDVVWPTETNLSLDKDMVLVTETQVPLAKDLTVFKEEEMASPIKMDLTPAEDMVSVSETEMALAKDHTISTEIFPAMEASLSPGTEVALTGDVTLPQETKDVTETEVATLIKDMTPPPQVEASPIKVVAPSPETEVTLAKGMPLSPETEMTPAKGMVIPSETEVTPAKSMTLPTETEVTPVKDVAPSPETEVAPVKDVAPFLEEVSLVKDPPLPPKTAVTLPTDVALSSGTDVTQANDLTPTTHVTPPSKAEVAPVPIQDMETAWTQGGITENSQFESLQDEKQPAAPTCLTSPEPAAAMGQKYNLPTEEDPVVETLEQKKQCGGQSKELASETSGTPTQAKQVCRPNDHRWVRPKPARVPPEMLGGCLPQKTLDPRLGPCPVSELDLVSGSSSCGELGNQRKTIDVGREAWDTESTPMMMKKKKKKTKQKRYPQPRAGGLWGEDSRDVPESRSFAAASRKLGVLPTQGTTMDTEYGPVSTENSTRECVVDSGAATPGAENSIVSERLRIPMSSKEQHPKAEVISRPRLRVEPEVKGDKSVPLGQNEKSLQQDECKPQPVPQRGAPVHENQRIGSPALKEPLSEISAHHRETPLESRPRDDCSPVTNQEVRASISRPQAAKELPDLTPTLTASNPLENILKEGDDKNQMTKLQTIKQKESSKGTEAGKELQREAFPKAEKESSVFASEQLQDKVLDQAPELADEPFKRMAGDGKNRKGRGSSGKMRANSGKVRARYELFPLVSPADVVPGEPALRRGVTTEEQNAELGLDSSKQPGPAADLTGAVVTREPKDKTDPAVPLIPLGNQSDMTQTSGGKAERGAEHLDMGVSHQSKEGKCPWMDAEASPRISEKPERRVNESKTKKFKNSYSTQPAGTESKAEIITSPFAGNYGGATSSPQRNKELGLDFPQMQVPSFSGNSDTPTVALVDGKANSFELEALSENKTSTAKPCAVPGPAAIVIDVSSQDQIHGVGFVPVIPTEERKTDAAKGHTAVADKLNKRSSDGKSKKVKNNFPEKHIQENKLDATKIHVPMETTEDHRIEGLGYVDENRNITFTCPRTPPRLASKSTPVEAVESSAYKKLPAPAAQVGKERESFPNTCTESGHEAVPVQISRVLEICSKDGQERPQAPSASTDTGVALVFPADHLCKNKGGRAEPRKSEAGRDGGQVVRESDSVQSGASDHSFKKATEPAEGHLLPRAPEEGPSPPGDTRGLEPAAGRSDFPAHPGKTEKNKPESQSTPVQTLDLPRDNIRNLCCPEDQNADCRDFKDTVSLKKGVHISLSAPEGEKDTSKETSLACKITELESVSLATPGLHSDFFRGKVAPTPSGVVDELVVTAPTSPQFPEPKDEILGSPLEKTSISEPMALGEGKKEVKSRLAEPMKGYMRPTKSRGLSPLPPKSAIQDLERSKPQKSTGQSQISETSAGGFITWSARESSEGKSRVMSLSDKQPASLTTTYSQLCKGKPAECQMDSPKEFSPAGFEWQRTEGKLNEIGLSVSVDRQLGDGLVRNAGFLEPKRRCCSEGKPDKGLGTEVQDKEYHPTPGHLESGCVISDKCSPSEGTPARSETAESHLGPTQGSDTNKATVQGKITGGNRIDTKSRPDPDFPGASDGPFDSVKEQETSVWNPNFHSVAPGPQGETAPGKKKDGISPGCPAIGVMKEHFGLADCESPLTEAGPHVAPTIEHSPPGIPPITMVEFAQERLNASSHSRDHDKEMEKVSSTEEGALLGQAPQQKKAIRRALSECSHLSVPPAVNLADKYPELPAREELSSGLLPPTSSPIPNATPRKSGASAMRRSMTVAEEQTPNCTLDPGELPVLSVKEIPPFICEEPVAEKREELTNLSSSSSSGEKAAGPAGLHLHSKLEQIPEGSSKGQTRDDVSAARTDDPRSQACQGDEKQPAATALAGKKEIEGSATQSTPSLLCEEAPRDVAKPEEGRPTVSVTGNDITTPPNKELPPSPEKKTKPLATTQPAKTSTSKAKPQSTSSPKQPAPTTLGGPNKKPMSLASGSVAAAPPKRPAAATARPSTLPSRDGKSKPVTEAKVPEKRPSLPKSTAVPATKAGSKSTQAVPRAPAAASPAAAVPGSRSSPMPLTKRPTASKTEGKLAEVKRVAIKSAPADVSRSKSTSAAPVKKNTASTGAAPSAGVAPHRVKSTPLPPRPSVTPTKDKKPVPAKSTSSAVGLNRLSTSASTPDLKNVRSKVGSTENIKHQPGGGRAKVEKKTETAATVRKPESNAVTKTTGSIASAPKTPAGKVQIVSKKLSYSHIQSKCGSKDNMKHVPGGGNVQIQNKKVDISKVSSKCGSKANIKHKPGEWHPHPMPLRRPTGYHSTVLGSHLPPSRSQQWGQHSCAAIAQVMPLTPLSGNPLLSCPSLVPGGDPSGETEGPPAGEEPASPEATHEAGTPTLASGLSGYPTLSGGGDQREAQTLDSQIQETSI
ncbi:microtubule-associated protein 4 [Echinops telfairi]|uniref:Microtubule-associated protein 4 n=1 Tax=Echinops telfairi TaxID=9371 RepID=A0AC55DPG7_ECHTE|nr:microtubule-associated protein 4 [Echinops telfairi]